MQNTDNEKVRYIETRAVMPNGKIITSFQSFPLGVDKSVYDQVTTNLIKSFGEGNTSTKCTFLTRPLTE